MKALLMILIFFPGVLSAQVELDLQLCREMAIRNSKEMEIADRQHRKAMFDTNPTGRIICLNCLLSESDFIIRKNIIIN